MSNPDKVKILDQEELLRNEAESAASDTNAEVRESNEINKEKVINALESSLEYVKNFSSKYNRLLSPNEQAILSWTHDSLQSAKSKMLKDKTSDFSGKYVVEVTFPDGQHFERVEGLPLDGLLKSLDIIKSVQARYEGEKQKLEAKQKQAKEFLDLLSAQSSVDSSDLNSLNVFLDKNPEFKQDLNQKIEEWLKADAGDGGMFADKVDPNTKQYYPDFYIKQAKLAVEELSEQYSKSLTEDRIEFEYDSAKLDEYGQAIKSASKNYFDFHFPGKAKGVGLEHPKETEQQNPFTKREAYFLEQDSEFRSFVEAQYKSEIPDYEQLDREAQNYQLAMLVLRDREVLDFSKLETGEAIEPPAPQETEPVITVDKLLLVNIDEIAKSMAWRKAEQQLHLLFENSGWAKRALKSVSEKYHLMKYYKEAWDEIRNNNDLQQAIRGRLSGQTVDRYNPQLKDYFQLLDEIIESYEKNLVELGETGDSLNQTHEVAQAVAQMLKAHASGNPADWRALGAEYADPNLEARQRVELYVKQVIVPLINPDANWSNQQNNNTQSQGRFARFFRRKKDQREPESSNSQSGVLYASNFWKLAEEYKVKVEHKRKEYLSKAEREQLTPEEFQRVEQELQEHMAGLGNLQIQLGNKERDLYNNKPKGILRFYEKAMDWSERTGRGWVGKLVNPLTVGIAAAVASRGALTAAKWAGIGGATFASGGVASAIIPLITGGAAGGIFRGFKAAKDLKYDIARERRNEVLGGDKSSLLDQKGGLRFNMISYDEVGKFFDTLKQSAFAGKTPEEIQNMPAVEQENLIKQRFDNLTEEEKATIARYMATHEAERRRGEDLFYSNHEQGAKTGSVIGQRNKLRELLRYSAGKVDSARLDAEGNQILNDIDAKDRKQTRMLITRGTWEGVKAGVIGIAAGATVQEGAYTVARHLGWMDGARGTALEAAIDKITNSPNHSYNWLIGKPNNLTFEGSPGLFQGPDGGSLTEEDLIELRKTHNVYIRDVDGNLIDESGNRVDESSVGLSSNNKPVTVLEELTRKDWHGVGRNFHGKELQQWHVWDKNKENVSIDVYNMMKNIDKNIVHNHTINWDKTTDPKLVELLQEMRANKANGSLVNRIQVRVFPTQEMYDSARGINLGAINSEGSLQVSGNMRELMFDSLGNQQARAIEVGYLDNSGQYHTLNTAVGTGNMEVPPPGDPSIIVSQLKPANYDWFVPLVPPGRKVWRRQGKTSEGADKRLRKLSEREDGSGYKKDRNSARLEKGSDNKLTKLETVKEDRVSNIFQESTAYQKSYEKLSNADRKQLEANEKYVSLDKNLTNSLSNNRSFFDNYHGFVVNLHPGIKANNLKVIFTESSQTLTAAGDKIYLDVKGDLESWAMATAAYFISLEKRAMPDSKTKTVDARKSERAGVKEKVSETKENQPPEWVGNNAAWRTLFVKSSNYPEGLVKGLKDNRYRKLPKQIEAITQKETFEDIGQSQWKDLFGELIKQSKQAKPGSDQGKLVDAVLRQVLNLSGTNLEQANKVEQYYEQVKQESSKKVKRSKPRGKKQQRSSAA